VSPLSEPSMSQPNAVPRFQLQPDRRKQAAERRKMERDLSRAVQRQEFILHYQPRYCLASGAIAGVEALARWPNRKHGLVAPGAFLPLAEQTGLITPLGGWVLDQACCAAAAWPDAGVTVSVNVSLRQIEDAALLRQVADALDRSGLPPDRLELELSESVLIDSDVDTLLTLSAIRDLGVGLALDEFGTGYASLSVLKRLPLTAMKLDRSLVQDAPHDREDAAILRAIVDTGHALGLTVVAEGVELENQRAFLAGIGCDEGQGFLFSQPLAADRLRALLHQR